MNGRDNPLSGSDRTELRVAKDILRWSSAVAGGGGCCDAGAVSRRQSARTGCAAAAGNGPTMWGVEVLQPSSTRSDEIE